MAGSRLADAEPVAPAVSRSAFSLSIHHSHNDHGQVPTADVGNLSATNHGSNLVLTTQMF